ncbi:hypothetical protein QBC43DRAFT_214490 [Cladorrhinum sp. PSN259]|nr:hypothetical protein QBC43DRAFT_214490 [Cladorrhinum sp. PSN259]
MEATDGGDKQSSSAKTYSVISFHEKGDTYIQVRDANGHTFLRVHKNLVSAISTAWSDKMKDSQAVIIAHDKAEKHDCCHVLKMLDQDDDPIGLIILFQLAHWKFHDLTDRLTIDELWALARISHKTECTFLVTPYAERWIVNGLHYQMTVNGASNDEGKIMVIAWVFGEARAFAKVLPQVVTNTSLSADGEVLLDRHGNPWAAQPIPSELIDMMKAIRLERLTRVMKTVDGPIHDMLEANNDFQYCRAKDSLDIKEACQSQQLGSLMSGLVKVGLLPFPDPHKYLDTITSIAEKLEDIKAVRYKVPGALPHNDTHITCGAKHKEKIRAIKEEPIRLTYSLAAALKRRGLTTGAFRHELFSEVQVSEGQFAVDENSFEVTKSPILSTQAWTQEFTANEDSEEE